MHRICSSLAENGYAVTLVGRRLPASLPLTEKKFKQKRLTCWFNKGKLFYFEYNLRLVIYLFFQKIDIICAIDLDTIIPCHTISKVKGIPRVYDAHELFTELKEVITRPAIQKIWLRVEKKLVPKFKYGYTVSAGIAQEFHHRYGVVYQTIRNMPVLKELNASASIEKFILYQGAVNEARGFEYLIPAMKLVNCRLLICGDGNFMEQLKNLISQHGVENKIELMGMLSPDKLWQVSQQAYIGVAIAEKKGLNQYLALPNKFFDYIHAGLPQLTMNYPEYQKINEEYEVAVLIDDLSPAKIAAALNNLLDNNVLHTRLKENCLKAREEFNWQLEEKKLLNFYESI
ncbi:group 1 glycosyl transferase [Chitinophagaceae bacterium IBVUCB2]|nr:group 1 glycosyl transferase [Chitinophagaceae bacterium IBVUCB2]